MHENKEMIKFFLFENSFPEFLISQATHHFSFKNIIEIICFSEKEQCDKKSGMYVQCLG